MRKILQGRYDMNLTEGIGQARNHFLGEWSRREPCWHCGKLTSWIEVSFQAHLHPGACTEAKWDEYAEACLRAPTSD